VVKNDWVIRYGDIMINNVIVPIIVAAATGWFSSKLAYRKEVKQTVYEKRQELYMEIFSMLEQLQRQPYLVFDYDRFVQTFYQMSAKAKLYASDNVLILLTPFIDEVLNTWDGYSDLFLSENAEIELQNRKENATKTVTCSIEQIEHEFNQDTDAYMERNLIPKEGIINLLDKLALQIRSELKTK
jgi:hypothetical protein